MNDAPRDSFGQVLEDLKDYLAWRSEEGDRALDVSPESLAMLEKKPLTSSPVPRERPRKSASEGGQARAGSAAGLKEIAGRIAGCRACGLCDGRTHTVPGQGSPNPDLMFVGEGPGADEDKQGLAFVGRAGKLLTKIIEAMGLTRDEVFIANIVKCRPPGNRAPTPEEMQACMPYLMEQIALLKPKVIVTLGATAAKGLLGTTTGITRLRGTWHLFEGIDTMPTYHPAYLLRNPGGKRPVWEDMQAVLERLGRDVPKQGG